MVCDASLSRPDTDTAPVKTRSPEALLLDILHRKGLAACVGIILRFVRVLFILAYFGLEKSSLLAHTLPAVFRCYGKNLDGEHGCAFLITIQDATLYLQRQLNLSDTQAQDFIEVRRSCWTYTRAHQTRNNIHTF